MKKFLTGTFVGLLLSGGVALASIPDGSGVIHGCYRTTNPAKGALIVIDDATETCPSGTVALSWSQTGPQGPQGSPGVSQYSMVQNQATLNGGESAVEVQCLGGRVPLGGGYQFGDFAPSTPPVVKTNMPLTDGWRVMAVIDDSQGPITLTVHAICAEVE